MLYNPPVGGAANDPYVDGNPGAGIQGSAVPAAAVEFGQREIVAAITAAGLTPSNANLAQLAAAIPILGGMGGVLMAQGTTIASASTVDVGAANSDRFAISGTATINSLGTTTTRNHVWVTATGAFTLTYNAVSLILPTQANITAAAGDEMEFVRISGGNWTCVKYMTAAGRALVGGVGYGTTTNSGNNYSLTTTPTFALAVGQPFPATFNATNTGAATLNVDGAGAKALVDELGNALAANAVVANRTYICFYDGTSIRLMKGTSSPSYGTTTNSGNTYSITTTPSFSSLTPGQPIFFTANAANTGAATLNPNGIGNTTLTDNLGNPLQPGALVANQTYMGVPDGTNIRVFFLSSVVFNSISGFLPTAMSGSSTTAAITVSAGQASDSTNSVMIAKNTSTSWSVANGNAINGYQGGSTLPSSSTIHMFICLGTSGVGTFASTSFAPTAPAGYNSFVRRIFSFNTGASTTGPLPYTADEIGGGAIACFLATPTTDVSTTTLGTTAVLFNLTVPSGIKVQWLFRANQGNNNASSCIITSPDETDLAPSTAGVIWTTGPGTDTWFQASNTVSATPGPGPAFRVTNTSGQIRCRAFAASTDLYCSTLGHIDFRRS